MESTTSLESTLHELTQFFEPSDDLLLIQEVFQLRKSLTQGFKEKDEQQQQYIDELTTIVHQTEENALAKEEPLKDKQARFERGSKEVDATRKRVDQLSKEKLKLSQEIENVKRANSLIRSNRKKLEQTTASAESVPKIKYLLSLYTLVSNIKWDYDSENCKGIISKPEKVTEFNFEQSSSVSSSSSSSSSSNSTSSQDFQLTNQLWSMISQV